MPSTMASGDRRRLRIRSIRHDPPDFEILATGLIELAASLASDDAVGDDARKPAAEGHEATALADDPKE